MRGPRDTGPKVTAPKVTVVVPVRNEAERLAACLDAIAASTFPAELVEVLVVDGGSTDGTDAVARERLADRGWAHAEALRSPAGDRSSNLNWGLAAAQAPVLVRVDARSRIPSHYLSRCVELLDAMPDAAVVGGRQRAVAASSTAHDIGVARALNNRWGMGLARYRRSMTGGRADTVYLGAYRTAQVRQVGGWRPDLAVNEDFDLNRRLAPSGAVWFDPELTVDYVPRSSLVDVARQYWGFGQGKARYWRVSGDRPRPRQALLLAAPVAAVALLALAWLGLGAAAATGLALGAVGLGVVVEGAGADRPHAGVVGHLVALATLAVVAASWWAGVAGGVLRPGLRTVKGTPAASPPVRRAA